MIKTVFFLTLAAAAFGQAPAAKPPLTFDVASIKPAPPLDPQKMMSGQMRIGMRVDKALVEINGMPLSQLINIAFKTKQYQVTGPSWLTAGNPMTMDRFDIHATLPEGATEKDVPEMLQALLAERFKLGYHRDNAEMSVYALVVAKGGPKMKEAEPDPPAGEVPAPKDDQPMISGRPDQKGGMVIRGGGPNGAGGNMRMSMQDGTMHMSSDKMSMTQLSDMLSPFLAKPIVDMTELKGNYQVALELTMADMMNVARSQGMAVGPPPGGGPGGPGGGAPGGAAVALGGEGAPDPGSSSVFRNVQQLGLKLEPRKSPIGKIIIDHLEKAPTEN